jgi:small subunit ribosomal protein S5
MKFSKKEKEFAEKVIDVNRVSKKTKGGNRFSFTSLVAVGDKKGRVGVALGKGPDVVSAIKKGIARAKKELIEVPLKDGTIPHTVEVKHGAARVVIKPAPRGTGLIAGSAVRDVLELAGVEDASAKILGTGNKLSNARAAIEALKRLRAPRS